MNKFIKAEAFLKHLFDQERLAVKAAVIIEAILAACSPRISEIAQHMPGREAANYKLIQRFLAQVDVKGLLLRLFQADAPFVIGDPTEMPRPQARKTSYVGKLKDGKTRGFWLLLLATPYRGRALPCGFVTYSSKTIAAQVRSRNQFHWQAFDELKGLLGDKPLVLDREFSYLELLTYLVQAQINFVIRLNLANHPTLYDATGRNVHLNHYYALGFAEALALAAYLTVSFTEVAEDVVAIRKATPAQEAAFWRAHDHFAAHAAPALADSELENGPRAEHAGGESPGP